MTHGELQELLGAYALDAVSPDEALAIERHLADCPRCRAEVSAHLEVASFLGNAGASEPVPDGVWDRIANALEEEPPVSEVGLAKVRPIERYRVSQAKRLWLPQMAAVAAAAVVIGLLAVRLNTLSDQVHGLQNALAKTGVSQGVAAALLDPNHRTYSMASTDGSGAALVILEPNGVAYWVPNHVLALPTSETYQVWGLVRGQTKPVSLGVIGAAPSISVFRVEPTVTELMVTAEPTGGTPAPTGPVLMKGLV